MKYFATILSNIAKMQISQCWGNIFYVDCKDIYSRSNFDTMLFCYDRILNSDPNWIGSRLCQDLAWDSKYLSTLRV